MSVERSNGIVEKVRYGARAATVALAAFAVAAAGCSQSSERSSESTVTTVSSAQSIPPETTTPKPSPDFIGGCAPFRVYAQNRWLPYGTAIRQKPDVLSPKVGGFEPNEVIAVNGWIHTGEPVYPTNQPPFNNDEWFHVANQAGWVSFAGVRAVPTENDPTLHANGGQPAATPPNCEGTYSGT